MRGEGGFSFFGDKGTQRGEVQLETTDRAEVRMKQVRHLSQLPQNLRGANKNPH